MNPPFSNGRDIQHVQHAYNLLRPGGRIVSIMGEGAFFQSNKRAEAFREWLDERGATSEKLPDGSFMDPSLPVNTAVNARMVVIDKPMTERARPAEVVKELEGAGPATAVEPELESADAGQDAHFGTRPERRTGTTTDHAIMDMVRTGEPVRDILGLVAESSSDPWRRDLAQRLLASGAVPSVRLERGELGAGDGFDFLAKYSRAWDEVVMTPGAGHVAELIFLHEMVHAATLKSLDRKGLASTQMRHLFGQVKASGALDGHYGMKNVGEFVAEAFTNPKFQQALRQLPAPKGSMLQNAWDALVRIVRSMLGLPQKDHDALARALELGAAVMREDKALRAGGVRGGRGQDAQAGINQTLTDAFKRWYGDWQNAAHVPQQMEPNRGRASAAPDGRGADVNGLQRPAGLDQDAAGADRGRRFTFSGASGPTGADGAPVRLYHGTRDDIAAFDLAHPRRKDNGWLGNGVYLTSNLDDANQYPRAKRGAAGPNLMPLYASVHNPYVATPSEKNRIKLGGKAAARAFTERVKNQGHDGVVLDLGDGAIELVAFESTQVKSAIGNNGNFDLKDDDVAHFGMADARSIGQNSSWNGPAASQWDDFVYKLQDKHIDTKRVLESIKAAGKSISDDLDVYLQEELYHGRAAKRTEDFVTQELEPLVRYMASAGLKMPDVQEYLHARHAKEVNAVIAERNPKLRLEIVQGFRTIWWHAWRMQAPGEGPDYGRCQTFR